MKKDGILNALIGLLGRWRARQREQRILNACGHIAFCPGCREPLNDQAKWEGVGKSVCMNCDQRIYWPFSEYSFNLKHIFSRKRHASLKIHPLKCLTDDSAHAETIIIDRLLPRLGVWSDTDLQRCLADFNRSHEDSHVFVGAIEEFRPILRANLVQFLSQGRNPCAVLELHTWAKDCRGRERRTAADVFVRYYGMEVHPYIMLWIFKGQTGIGAVGTWPWNFSILEVDGLDRARVFAQSRGRNTELWNFYVQRT